MELQSFNTVESQLAFHHEEKMREFESAALNALERVRNDLDGGVIRPVVTRYEMSRNIYCRQYTKIHTMDYAVWPVDGILFLCSDGRVYCEQPDRDFWNRKVTNLMPVEYIRPDSYDLFIPYLDRMGTRKSRGITGFAL